MGYPVVKGGLKFWVCVGKPRGSGCRCSMVQRALGERGHRGTRLPLRLWGWMGS